MKVNTKITFVNDQKEKFFGEGPCQLLREVERTGSLNAAAGSMGMAYTKALKILKNAEKNLGFPLTRRSAGGKSGGGSSLTREGLEWLEKYETYRDTCLEANLKLYREFFPDKENSPVNKKIPDIKESMNKEITFPKTGLVIMASGIGKRFGSNKLLADFDGQPMIRRILDTSENLFEKRLVVTRHQEVEKICRDLDIPVILHDYPDKNDTIRLGVEYMEKDMETCIFTPADQPLLTRESLIRMGEVVDSDRDRIFRTFWEDRAGAPVAFPAWTFRKLKSLPVGEGGSLLFKEYPEHVGEVMAGSEWELMDVDTPENLEELLQIWKTLFFVKVGDVPQN